MPARSQRVLASKSSGASCDAAFDDRTFFGFVLDMTFGGSAWARIGADKPPPPEARRPSREAMGLAGDEPRDGDGGDGGGGGGGAAAAAPAAGGGGGDAPAKAPEPEEEEEDMGFDLFD